jgi:prepilin-type N-terminal cleavage/methylation domain-containing protein
MTLKRPANAADHRSMATSRSRLSAEHGYTLVELMVAALVLVIGMAGAFAMLNGANRTTVTNNARMGATNLARELAEDARSVDYDKLNPTDMVGALQAKAGFSGAASPWKIQRRGIEYTPPRSASSTIRRTTSRRPRPPTSARRRRPCPSAPARSSPRSSPTTSAASRSR